MAITTYLSQLQAQADKAGVSLKEAFEAAGIPDSTYYRAINGTTELRLDTAMKVWQILEHRVAA